MRCVPALAAFQPASHCKLQVLYRPIFPKQPLSVERIRLWLVKIIRDLNQLNSGCVQLLCKFMMWIFLGSVEGK